ncbi:MAG TPA: DUF192 domain-containing protein [Bryobacteraceae bacterium]|nr:DUF192 domain-containing protein [Bryobacteraceae bacterium]
MRFAALLLASMALISCGPKTVSWEEFHTRTVVLPDGKKVVAEVVTEQVDMMRGMMYRDSLAQDRAMLFTHGSVGKFGYWMYNVKIPLDILWLNANRTVVEIVPNARPCPGPASQCPSYGGKVDSLYVLELAGGVAAKHGIKVGDTLRF